MKKKYLLTLTLIFVFSFVSANHKKENHLANNSISSVNSNTKEFPAKPLPGKYKLKSGIVYINIENSMVQGNSKAVLYFDDYGNKECTETNMEMEMMGQKMKVHQLAMFLNGYLYTIDLEKKTGTKMKLDSNIDPSKFDYEHLDPKIAKEYNIKKEGTETLLGKRCDIYSMNYSKMNMKGKTWIWNGINMKTDMNMGGLRMKTITTKIDENVPVPSSKFVIPSGIKIQEM